MRTRVALLSAALLVFLAAGASASTVRYMSDAAIIGQSDRVVHGRVIAQRTIRDGAARAIYTVTTLAVIEDLTGVESTTVDVWELGGTVGREALHIGGAVRFEIGSEVLVCLRQGRRGFHAIGMGLSAFDLTTGGDGRRRLMRQVKDTLVLGGPRRLPNPSLEEFRELAQRVTGRAARTGRTPEAAVSQPVQRQAANGIAGAVFVDGSRWREADTASPIRYYINTGAPSPIYPADPVPAVQTAVAAWTNPPAASIILQYGGFTTQPSSEGPWNGTIPANSVVISFEDPDNEIDDPVLAFTASFSIQGAGGTLHGTTFDALTDAAIKFNNAADLPASFRQSADFTRVLTHEVGHSLGLGHTQDDGTVIDPQADIMFASCCSVATPTPPSIGPDDLDSLTYLYPAGGACTYAVGPSSTTAAPGGNSGYFKITTYAQCGWSAVSNNGFVTIGSSTAGAGTSIVFYTVAPNPGPARSGTLTIAGQTVTVTQGANLPQMALDKSSLTFGAVTSGGAFSAQTTAQVLRLTQNGPGPVTWTATTNQSWLRVDRATGSGSATLVVSVASVPGLPSGGVLNGTVTLSYGGASTSTSTVAVSLVLKPLGTSTGPFGFVDTPAENATGVTGAVPFTGWALDDIEVVGVSLCRAPVPGEGAGADARCGGAAQIYLSDALFIDGARPDVDAGYPLAPRHSRAGWGVMVLTNFLPNQGNGTYQFFMYARDTEGATTALGSRTMTCDNANATRPFGTIDTPGQGETVSGSSVVNFGWALTQNPKVIPVDGSTLTVYVDGVPLGHPSYDNYRSDIATLFPGLANSNGAVGFLPINTLSLANGLHTIVWTATDSGGNTEGLGSRYFRVSNGSALTRTVAASTAAAPLVLSADSLARVPLDTAGLTGRRGWDPGQPWREYPASAEGAVIVRGEEVDKLEVQLTAPGEGRYTGYQRVGDRLEPLPAGAQVDPTGHLTWSPGVGFVGTYDLVFVRWSGAQPVARTELRVILQPKQLGAVGPRVVIDTPSPLAEVEAGFTIAGWAADLESGGGAGIATVHVWAYPIDGGAPVFLGVANSGLTRPDVAAAYGDQFASTGYGLTVRGLGPGTYDLAVFGWSQVRAGFAPAAVVRVTVR